MEEMVTRVVVEEERAAEVVARVVHGVAHQCLEGWGSSPVPGGMG